MRLRALQFQLRSDERVPLSFFSLSLVIRETQHRDLGTLIAKHDGLDTTADTLLTEMGRNTVSGLCSFKKMRVSPGEKEKKQQNFDSSVISFFFSTKDRFYDFFLFSIFHDTENITRASYASNEHNPRRWGPSVCV